MICKCTECHHEWQQCGPDIRDCDWCGKPGMHLENDYIEEGFFETILDPKFISNLAKEMRDADKTTNTHDQNG